MTVVVEDVAVVKTVVVVAGNVAADSTHESVHLNERPPA